MVEREERELVQELWLCGDTGQLSDLLLAGVCPDHNEEEGEGDGEARIQPPHGLEVGS